MVDRHRALAALVVVTVTVPAGGHVPSAQQAEDDGRSHSREEVAALARQAETDRAARARLRAIKRVDGRPRPIDRALADADEAETQARLRHLARLAAQPRGPQPADGDTRSAARRAVAEPAEPPPEPSPRRRSWLARVLAGIVDLLAAILTSPLTLVLVVVGIAVAILRAVRGRNATLVKTDESDAPSLRTAARAPGVPAEELERAAAQAEREGDLDSAVRLLFQAGLARLTAAGRLAPSDTTPNGAVRRALRSRPFDVAADGFERVVYGQSRAAPEDVHTARSAWAEVLR